jgi:hypothetical protein
MDESVRGAAADVSRRRSRAARWLLVLVAGLLTATVVVGAVVRPWRNTPWWPGVDIASATPDPCPALDTETAGRLMPTAVRPRPSGSGADPRRECTLMGRAGLLSAEIIRITDGDLRAGAEREFTTRAARYEARESVPDLGDAAAVGFPGTESVIVLARRGNVVVTVYYFPGSAAPSLSDGGQADCVAVARIVVAAIQVK